MGGGSYGEPGVGEGPSDFLAIGKKRRAMRGVIIPSARAVRSLGTQGGSAPQMALEGSRRGWVYSGGRGRVAIWNEHGL